MSPKVGGAIPFYSVGPCLIFPNTYMIYNVMFFFAPTCISDNLTVLPLCRPTNNFG